MSLREEIGQKRPFSTVEEEALISIFVTGDLLSHGLHTMLREYSLTLAQYNVLRILRGAGDNGLPLMTIARRMIVRYPNITRLTDRLEADGLIRRERCTSDRRVVRAFVSPVGLELLGKINGEIDRYTVHLMRGANADSLRSLIDILQEVRVPLRDGKSNGNGA